MLYVISRFTAADGFCHVHRTTAFERAGYEIILPHMCAVYILYGTVSAKMPYVITITNAQRVNRRSVRTVIAVTD